MVGYMIWLVFIIEFWLNNQVKNFLWYLLNDYTTTSQWLIVFNQALILLKAVYEKSIQ